MPLVAIAIGVIGSAIGTAIGAAIGGTLLGVAAATIGGVIGAGVAGGIYSKVTGGDFGKGFLMGAAGGAVGAFLGGGLGGASSASAGAEAGATIAADGTTSAGMLANQAWGAEDLLGTDISGASGYGTGDIGGTNYSGGEFGNTPMDIGAPGGQSQPFSLDTMGNTMGVSQPDASLQTPNPDYALSNNLNTPLGSDSGPFSQTANNVMSYGGDQAQTGSAPLEQSAFNPSTNTNTPQPTTLEGTTQNAAPIQEGATDNQGLGGTIKNAMNTSDSWLKNTFGAPSGSTGKLLLGGAQTLYDNYQADKLQRQANKMKPLTFSEFQAQYMDPNAYKIAANQMARGGHTGTLPVMLARMKQNASMPYTKYITQQNQQSLENNAAIGKMKQNSLSNLFAPFGQQQGLQKSYVPNYNTGA